MDAVENPLLPSPPPPSPSSLLKDLTGGGGGGRGEALLIPRPLEALQGTPIPAFLTKTYELVEDPSLDRIISWSPTGESFVVWDPMEFSRSVLPRHFKHNNFSSFVRQLNTYGFRKIGTDRWEFANEDFLCGKRALLKNINRRRSSQVQQAGSQMESSVMVVKSGAESEVQKLKKDKDQLMQEIVQLRQEHEMTAEKIDALNQRMQSAQRKQKQMVSFLAKLLQNSMFLGNIRKEQREIASMRVRRRFLKQQQKQFVKYKSSFKDASASLLPGIEQGVNEFSGGSDGTLLEEKKLMFGCIGSDFTLSSPDAITPEEVVPDEISPMCLSFYRPKSTIFAFEGKDVRDTEAADNAARIDFLATINKDVAQDHAFPDAITPGSDCVTEEGIWNGGLESVGSSSASGRDFWDNVGTYDTQEIDGVAGSGSIWDLGLHNLEEYLDIEKFGEVEQLNQ